MLTHAYYQPTGVSPLMMACSVGNVEAARALLMFGASLDLEDVSFLLHRCAELGEFWESRLTIN